MASTLATFYRDSWNGKHTHTHTPLHTFRQSSWGSAVYKQLTNNNNNFINSNLYITLRLWIMQSTSTKIGSQIPIKNYWNECNGCVCVCADVRQSPKHRRDEWRVVLQFIVMIASNMKHIHKLITHTHTHSYILLCVLSASRIQMVPLNFVYKSSNSWNASDNLNVNIQPNNSFIRRIHFHFTGWGRLISLLFVSAQSNTIRKHTHARSYARCFPLKPWIILYVIN